MGLIADIFITSKNRATLLGHTLNCIREHTARAAYRLTVVQDGRDEECLTVIDQARDIVDHLILHGDNLGLAPSVNDALAHIHAINEWFSHPTHGEPEKVAPFICWLQDDVLVSGDWLTTLATSFAKLEDEHNLGFASGVECLEHPVVKQLEPNMILKRTVRGANMFGRREYWTSMYPIPRLNPDTGLVRGKPHAGMGSGVDWWFVRTHPNSITQSGRQVLVLPGLMVHAGYQQSTWSLTANLESNGDKKRVRDVIGSNGAVREG